MEIKNKKSFTQRSAIILAIIIGVATVNLFASRHFARLDLTRNHLFTLAQPTKNILKSLDDVVTVRLYFTVDLPPAMRGLRRDVDDLLSEFKTYSKSKVQIEYYNPQENEVTKQKVRMMGIPSLEVTVFRKDQQELASVYLGMTVGYGNKQEVLDVIQNTSNLEYRLVSAIQKVSQTETPVLGWWGPLPPAPDVPQQERGAAYETLLEQLKQRFEIKTLSKEKLDQWNPKEIPTLLFVTSDETPKEMVDAVTKYMDEGGKAILLLEQVHVGIGGVGLNPEIKENPFKDLLKTYGVELTQDLALDASNAMATFSGGQMNFVLPYPFWVRIRPESFNPTQPMVSELRSLVLPWTNVIKIEEKEKIPEGVTVTPLFKSTPFCVTHTPNPGVPLDPQMAKTTSDTGAKGQTILGVMAGKKKAALDSQLLVIGNSYFLQNVFLEQFPENLIFIENGLDVFSTGGALVGIRSKGVSAQPLAIVSDSMRAVIKALDIFLSPILLLGLGAAVLLWRKKRAKYLKTLYAKA